MCPVLYVHLIRHRSKIASRGFSPKCSLRGHNLLYCSRTPNQFRLDLPLPPFPDRGCVLGMGTRVPRDAKSALAFFILLSKRFHRLRMSTAPTSPVIMTTCVSWLTASVTIWVMMPFSSPPMGRMKTSCGVGPCRASMPQWILEQVSVCDN